MNTNATGKSVCSTDQILRGTWQQDLQLSLSPGFPSCPTHCGTRPCGLAPADDLTCALLQLSTERNMWKATGWEVWKRQGELRTPHWAEWNINRRMDPLHWYWEFSLPPLLWVVLIEHNFPCLPFGTKSSPWTTWTILFWTRQDSLWWAVVISPDPRIQLSME